jgi:hypothetical protein
MIGREDMQSFDVLYRISYKICSLGCRLWAFCLVYNNKNFEVSKEVFSFIITYGNAQEIEVFSTT